MLIVRPARVSDLQALVSLAKLAGPGFTSLSMANEEHLARLKNSADSFAQEIEEAGDQVYMLMLEDSESGEIVGVSSIKALIGGMTPFFNFKLFDIAQSSSVAKRHFTIEAMLLVNEYAGASEVGTLFVHSKMRGTGAGRLISQARYMLIAAAPQRFADTVISELRGCVDADGYSPFWESLGRKFFKMDFDKADIITAESGNQFIIDLMPKHPIYTNLLSEEAQAVIGKTHPDGAGARKLLEAEGFRYERCIDLFDGGPTLAVQRDQIRIVKQSGLVVVEFDETKEHTHTALVSNNNIANFRTVYTGINIAEGKVCLPQKVAKALEVQDGDQVRCFLK